VATGSGKGGGGGGAAGGGGGGGALCHALNSEQPAMVIQHSAAVAARTTEFLIRRRL
jgi:hypothetical protein